MAHVNVCIVSGVLSSEQKVKLANDITGLITQAISELAKESLSAVFNEVPPEDWVVGGITIKEIMEKK